MLMKQVLGAIVPMAPATGRSLPVESDMSAFNYQ